MHELLCHFVQSVLGLTLPLTTAVLVILMFSLCLVFCSLFFGAVILIFIHTLPTKCVQLCKCCWGEILLLKLLIEMLERTGGVVLMSLRLFLSNNLCPKKSRFIVHVCLFKYSLTIVCLTKYVYPWFLGRRQTLMYKLN